MLVEPQPRADAGHEQPRRLVGPGSTGSGARRPSVGRSDQGPGGTAPKRAARSGTTRGVPASSTSASGQPAPSSPSRPTTRGLIASPSATPLAAARAALPALGVEEVDQGERDVLVVRRQRLRRDGARLLGGLRLGGMRPEVAQDRHATLADDLLGDLVHGGQHPADAARRGLVGHGAVGDREVGLLDEAVAVDLQEDVLHPRRRPAVEGGVDERADDVPDLRPAFRRPAAPSTSGAWRRGSAGRRHCRSGRSAAPTR